MNIHRFSFSTPICLFRLIFSRSRGKINKIEMSSVACTFVFLIELFHQSPNYLLIFTYKLVFANIRILPYPQVYGVHDLLSPILLFWEILIKRVNFETTSMRRTKALKTPQCTCVYVRKYVRKFTYYILQIYSSGLKVRMGLHKQVFQFDETVFLCD